MKTFASLKFKPHDIGMGAEQARMDFQNGYGVSVVTGSIFCTSPNAPYEVAVLKNGSLCYDTPITNDVIGYQTAGQVTEIMKQIQKLPKAKKAASRPRRVTGGSQPGGLGLKLLHEFARLNKGRIHIVSRFSFYEFNAGHESFAKLENDFPGTAVTLEVNTADTSAYCLASEVTREDIF